MPSDETLLAQAQELKAAGNEAFGKGDLDLALSKYSLGIATCDRMLESPSLKTTMLGNRALVSLKMGKLASTREDCTKALSLLRGKDDEKALRSKLLFRRAKSAVLETQLKPNVELTEEAAKDLVSLLQLDPSNKEGKELLIIVRSQHSKQNTPASKIIEKLRNGSSETAHELKRLLSFLHNDTTNTSMELGRLGAVALLLDTSFTKEAALLGLQVVSTMSSHPAACRSYCVDIQGDLLKIIQSTEESSLIVTCLAIYTRIILHADRDDPSKDISGTTKIDYKMLIQCLHSALKHSDITIIRATLDVLATWTCGTDRDTTIRASLTSPDPTLKELKSPSQVRNFTPQQLAEYRKRSYDEKLRDMAWAFERSITFVDQSPLFLHRALICEDHVVRREMTVALGRLLGNIEEEDKIKATVAKFLKDPLEDGPKIVEVYSDDEKVADTGPTMEWMMEGALITSALLLSKPAIGAWAMNGGWSNALDHLETLIHSKNVIAMCLASEVLAAASTVEQAKTGVHNLMEGGHFQPLLMSDDKDIRSGAASAVAKLGMGSKNNDEGEAMGLLEAACELLEEETPLDDKQKLPTTWSSKGSAATSSIERAIEMLTYLVSHTIIKEEMAAGFGSRRSSRSALETLVNISEIPGTGESLTGFALGTIFQNMAATNLEIRKEGFEGKEVTMEQYDEMQLMGKTPEEKEVIESQKDPDTPELCKDRIRKMASAGVPRAIVALLDSGASEHTMEQLVQSLVRMAKEESIRGIMVQQGVLSACIRVEKKEGPTETDTMKKVIRFARHCIAKILISMNPALLTSAQRLGSIRPLIQLIRDNKSSDLQQFEALMALTNLGSGGTDAQNRIVTEKGIPSLHYCMFSDHTMVRRAATEAMCNLVQHQKMLDHLVEGDHLKLWLAFASDYEDENYECARAATGCLAMATQDESVALKVVEAPRFKEEVHSLLESGRLEIMHRALFMVLNLVSHEGPCLEETISAGIVAFCEAYAGQAGKVNEGIEFSPEEKALLPHTLDLAGKIAGFAS